MLWLQETYPDAFDEKSLLLLAFSSGEVGLLRWLIDRFEKNVQWNDILITKNAVLSGNVKMVQFVVSKGAPIDERHELVKSAAATNVAMMKLLHENKNYLLEYRDEEVARIAAQAGQLPILEYLHANSYPIPSDLGQLAFNSLRLDILQWCKQNGFANFALGHSQASRIFTAGIRSVTRLRMLEYLIQNNRDEVAERIRSSSDCLFVFWTMPVAMWKLVLELVPKPGDGIFMLVIFSTEYYTLETVRFLVEKHQYRVPPKYEIANNLKLIRKDVLAYLSARGFFKCAS